MDVENEERMKLIQEINQIKLDLNQSQQEKSSLELELHQKDEIILKTQLEAQQKESQYLLEMKLLRENLQIYSECNNNEVKEELQAEIANLRKIGDDLKAENAKLEVDLLKYSKENNLIESQLAAKEKEIQAIQSESGITKTHLNNLELAFSDIHSKYERLKNTIAGYAANEDALRDKLATSNQVAKKFEERYHSLKSHAKTQLDKAYKDMLTLKEKHEVEISKHSTCIRRLEIKNTSIQQSLDQKTKECAALADLCDQISTTSPQSQ